MIAVSEISLSNKFIILGESLFSFKIDSANVKWLYQALLQILSLFLCVQILNEEYESVPGNLKFPQRHNFCARPTTLSRLELPTHMQDTLPKTFDYYCRPIKDVDGEW